jgi:putative ABC transport system permease protein
MITALLAIALGAAVLSGLASISLDIPRQMGQEFRSYGANMALVPRSGYSVFTRKDLDKAAELLPDEELVGLAPYRFRMIKINEQPFMAAGTKLEEARKTSPYWFVQGRWPEKTGEALIGREVAETIRLLPGSAFTVAGTGFSGNKIVPAGSGGAAGGEGRDFVVSGIVETGGKEEAFIFMSLGDFEDMTGEAGNYDTAECSISLASAELAELADRINAASIGAETSSISARLVKRVTDSESVVLTKLTALIFLVSAIILILIMICVATTMMAVVAERRKEIGLRKALGAGVNDLVGEFLGEGVFLGLSGGLLGGLAGFGFAQIVGLKVFNRSVGFDPLLLIAAALLSVCITVLACAIPVRAAAAVDPAIVLRGE